MDQESQLITGTGTYWPGRIGNTDYKERCYHQTTRDTISETIWVEINVAAPFSS